MSYIKTIAIDNTNINVAVIGQGQKPLIMLPGLSLTPVTPAHEAIAERYQAILDDYTIYLIDQREAIPARYSILDMSDDVFAVMSNLGLRSASVFGVSLGGMIAQTMAISHPERVDQLVVTSVCANAVGNKALAQWIQLAKHGNGSELSKSVGKLVYSPAAYESNKEIFARMGAILTSEDLSRLIIIMEAAANFNVDGEVSSINCPTAVIGAKGDQVFDYQLQEKLARDINCEIFLYDESFSHAIYDEAPDFTQRLKDTLARMA